MPSNQPKPRKPSRKVLELDLKEAQASLERLQSDNRSLDSRLSRASAYIKSRSIHEAQKDEEIQELNVNVAALRAKLEEAKANAIPDHYMEIPKLDAKQLKAMLKGADKNTLDLMIEYIKLDSFLLVKNLAKTINKDNVSEAIAYQDGALGRNDALIEVLTVAKKESFANLRTGQMERTESK